MMKIAMLIALSSVNNLSSSTWLRPPPDDIISKDATFSIGKAATSSPLVRLILDAYGAPRLEKFTLQVAREY